MLRTFLGTFVATALVLGGMANGQSLRPTPAPPASTQFSSFGYQEEEAADKTSSGESDDEALAKQMDEFHKRLKDLEKGAADLADAQEDGPFGERLDHTEQSLQEYDKAINKINGSLGEFVKSGHGDMTMKLFGRIHADYWHFASEGDDIDTLEGGDPQDRFIFRRMRIGVSGNIDDNMFYKIEMEFAGGNATQYRDAYLGFDHLPVLQKLIIGNQKRPYGLDQLNSSQNNVFMERPFINDAVQQDTRRLGIASYGVSDDLCNNWRFGVFNQQLVQDRAGYVGDHYQLEAAGRYARTWWWDEASNGRGYGHFALSSSYGEPDGNGPNNQSRYRARPEARSSSSWLDTGTIAGASDFLLTGVEGVLNVGPTQIGGEYMLIDVDRFDAVGTHAQFNGGYVYASYFLTGEHIPWNRRNGTLGRVQPFENFFSVCDCDGFRQTGMGAWQVAARYSYADFSDSGIDGGIGNALTLGLNWYWNAYARVQLNYIVGDIESAATVAGDYQIIGARFMVDF